MKVFISWSGERSKMLASGLREFLPAVIQAVKPFMSEWDVEAGSRWPSKLNQELENTQVAVICLTPENLDSRWVHYEAGALSKQIDTSRICTCLVGLKPSDVKWPLAQFYANNANKIGIRAIVETINKSLASEKLAGMVLTNAFSRYWPDLSEIINKLPTMDVAPDITVDAGRSDRELIQEILQIVRGMSRHPSSHTTMLGYSKHCLHEAVSTLDPSKNEFMAHRPGRSCLKALGWVKEARLYGSAELDVLLKPVIEDLETLSQVRAESDDMDFWEKVTKLRQRIYDLALSEQK